MKRQIYIWLVLKNNTAWHLTNCSRRGGKVSGWLVGHRRRSNWRSNGPDELHGGEKRKHVGSHAPTRNLVREDKSRPTWCSAWWAFHPSRLEKANIHLARVEKQHGLA